MKIYVLISVNGNMCVALNNVNDPYIVVHQVVLIRLRWLSSHYENFILVKIDRYEYFITYDLVYKYFSEKENLILIFLYII